MEGEDRRRNHSLDSASAWNSSHATSLPSTPNYHLTMPPLTVDSDGWFTVATDTQSSLSSAPQPAEKLQNEKPVRSYGQLSFRPSTGPARRKDGPVVRSPSGWIIAVDDVQREHSASSGGASPPNEVPVTNVGPLRSRSSSESTECKKPDAGISMPVNSHEGKEKKSGGSDASSDGASNQTSISSVLEPPVSLGAPRDWAMQVEEVQGNDNKSSPSETDKLSDKLLTSSSLAESLQAATKDDIKSSNASINSTDSAESTDTTPATIESADTASITSTPSTSVCSSAVASSTSSASDTPKKLRPRARSSPQPIPTLGIDPKLLVGKVLTHIRRSTDHPTVTLSFADGTTYQILVDGYDPRNMSTGKENSNQCSRTCVLEMDEALLRMLEVPGRHVVDRAITDCAHIRLADKAYERREWEHSWQQSHVAVAFKFAEESRWHCVWAMRAEYDERGCIFRTFDDVYLQVLERQLPRSPQRRKKTPPSPMRSPGKVDLSAYKPGLKPPPSPTAMRSSKSASKTPKKNLPKKGENDKTQ